MSEILKSENIYWAKIVPDLLMQDASDQNELLLQYLSDSPTERAIDLEVGSLGKDFLCPRELLTYVRYNAVLEQDELSSPTRTVSEEELESLRDMSIGDNATTLYEIDQEVAKRDVLDSHFPSEFNPNAKVG